MAKRIGAVGLALVLAGGLLSGCSSGRSVDAYCGVLEKHKDRYVTAMAEATDVMGAGSLEGLLGGMTQAISALGDLNTMWAEASKVAPEEIATDVEAVAETFEKQQELVQDMIDDPLGALVGGLSGGLTNAAAMQRVNDYTIDNCPSVGGMFYN